MLREFRTEQILEAARQVMGQVGHAEASMDRIAEEGAVALRMGEERPEPAPAAAAERVGVCPWGVAAAAPPVNL